MELIMFLEKSEDFKFWIKTIVIKRDLLHLSTSRPDPTRIQRHIVMRWVTFLQQKQRMKTKAVFSCVDTQPRILVEYQSNHVTYQLKISSINLLLANQSQSSILNQDLWWVGQHQIHGENNNLIGHVTSLVPCKDSSLVDSPAWRACCNKCNGFFDGPYHKLLISVQ